MKFISIYILFCSFQIHQIQNAPSSNSNNQIDEFIVQLMTSEKFNELADIIAEKAAKKIKNYSKKNFTARHSVRIIEKRERNKKPIKEKQNGRDVPPDSMLRQRNIKEKSNKFGKINKAFLKTVGLSKELSLNYKHMTKELKKNFEKTVEDAKEENKKHRDVIFSDHSVEQSKPISKAKTENVNSESSERKHNIKYKSKSEENITKHRSFTSEEKHSNSEDKHIDEDQPNKSPIKKSKTDNFSNENLTRENSKEEHKNKKPRNRSPKTKNDDISSDSSHSEIKKNTESKKTDDTNSSKEIVEVGIKRAYDDNKSGESGEHHEVKVDGFSDELDSSEKPSTVQKKQIIRRENGKLYTYLSSSDYDEYHEHFRNQRQQVFAKNRYINT